MTTFVPNTLTKRNLFSNKIESRGVDCKRVFKIEKATSTAWTNKLAPKSFSTTKCIWAKRRRVSKRKLKNLSQGILSSPWSTHPEQNQNWPMECCNHFQEISFKIDKHRHELKEKHWRNLFAKWLTMSIIRAFEKQYMTTNSDLTTISTAATTKFQNLSMQEMQDLNTRNYAIPTMLIDDDIRRNEQEQEANVAVLKTHKLDEMTKIKDHLQINRFEPQLFACSTFYVWSSKV